MKSWTRAPSPDRCRSATATESPSKFWRALAGAETIQLGNAPDEKDALRAAIERGLEADILVLSGGVSMGKYDLVEQVLADLGAEFHFTGVAIRPGRPAVFATCRGKLVFGLPGNPVSTMVTFELFVLPAVDMLERRGAAAAAGFSRKACDARARKRPDDAFPARADRMGRQGSASHAVALARFRRYRGAGAGEWFPDCRARAPRNCAGRMG